MHIGSVAEKSGVPPKTIRYYESIGLITPADRRPNGYRSYSAIDMRTLNFVKRARGLGFAVDEVRELLVLWRSKTRTSIAVKALATRHLQALDRKLAELRAMRRTLADLVVRCSGDANPHCPILDNLDEDATVVGPGRALGAPRQGREPRRPASAAARGRSRA